MRRTAAIVAIAGCIATLTLACYGRALVRGEEFGHRDAAQYYYPLYQKVQREWEAERWPLWEPEENAGMPLMGNPTAAVLYPGKLVFALTPYPLGARLYVVGHTLLAAASMFLLLSSWGTSWVGSALGALGYAFGGPVLFQSVLSLDWIVDIEIGGEVGEPPRPPKCAAKLRALQQDGPKGPLVLTT